MGDGRMKVFPSDDHHHEQQCDTQHRWDRLRESTAPTSNPPPLTGSTESRIVVMISSVCTVSSKEDLVTTPDLSPHSAALQSVKVQSVIYREVRFP